MTEIQLSLINFPISQQISETFKDYSNDYEVTAKGVFRQIVPPSCPECGHNMSHNGSNVYCKKLLGRASVGRYVCGACGHKLEENKDFWKSTKDEFFQIIEKICVLLRRHHNSYEVIEELLAHIYPRDKDTIKNIVRSTIDTLKVPRVENIQFVGYDEQHPKAGRNQKYRLTLIDIPTRQVIAEELAESKDNDTIEKFFRKNLDTHKQIFIVTDLYVGYDNLLKKIFGNKVTHQLCHFHLSQLIVKDFPRKTSISQELTKYELLNIFYNRNLEVEFLSCLIEEEKSMLQKSKQEYDQWIRRAMSEFRNFIHRLELKRRRNNETLEHRTYDNAKNILNTLLDRIESFEISVKKRLRRIEEQWHNLTAFYWVSNAPATNNIVENYYSTSLKTHRKNQLDTIGIQDQMKLSALNRAGIFGKPTKTLLDVFVKFIPFLDTG